MSDAITVGRAFLTMVVLMVFGVLLAFCVLMAKDTIMTMLISAGIDGGANTAWDSTHQLNIINALLLFICSLPPIMGIIIFALAVTKRQSKTEYYESGEMYYAEE